MNKRSYVWNTTASTLNSAMSAVLMLAVVRVLGTEEGGIFILGYSIAQLMLTIGYYDMRAFQATDVNNTYTFGEYFFSRMITCMSMMAASVAYILIRGYSGEKFLIILLLCIFKMTDAVEDIYHGQLQKLQHLDIAAFMQTVRMIVCMIVFTAVLVIKKDLLVSCIAAVGISLVLSTVPNIIISKKYIDFSEKTDIKKILRLLIVCLPLCIGSYLSLYIGNAPKYAIDRYMGNVEQSYYGILFMPSYVINLFSGYILRPTVTDLAEAWKKKEYKGFIRKVTVLFVIIGVLTTGVMAAAYLVGIDILNAVYSVDISQYLSVLMILLLGGGFYALGIVLYYIITIARRQKYMLYVYVVVSIAAFVLSDRLVSGNGLFGAAVSYLIATIIRFSGFLTVFILLYRRMNKGDGQSYGRVQ